MGYYISRALAALCVLMVLSAIVIGIIAVWSEGDMVARLGNTAGILGSAGGFSLIPVALWVSETDRPFHRRKYY